MRSGKRFDVFVGSICLAGKTIQWAKEIEYLHVELQYYSSPIYVHTGDLLSQ